MRAKNGLTVTNLGIFDHAAGRLTCAGGEAYHRRMLTPEEVAHYHETGQVTPNYRLGDEVVSDIRERMEAIFETDPDVDPEFAHGLIEADKGWLDYARHPDIVDGIAQLLGDNLLVWSSELFCKQPEGGKRGRHGIRMASTGPCGRWRRVRRGLRLTILRRRTAACGSSRGRTRIGICTGTTSTRLRRKR